ncbi:ABC transporter permease [Streptomyces sp. NPDC056661]|uniref:ABC transporter permease n=1 Tax=Streptomyces sp. NPDC056661 TaxID=3345898 RepID=UPI00367D7309
MTWLRTLVVAGLLTYRALFGWMSPWILVPSLIVTPLAQILFFAYIGRGAGVASDEFFIVGNAIQYAAIPCLIGTTSTIAGERIQGTLGLIFISPASRVALIVGRTLPVVFNGLGVSVFGLLAGSAVLGTDPHVSSLGSIVLTIIVSVIACTGLGLVNAALGLILRDTAMLSNLFFGALLLISGANIPRDSLPGWLNQLGAWLPLTHGIEAVRMLAAGATITGVSNLLYAEITIGIAYWFLGAVLLRVLEKHSRTAALLELS